ncbi:MAG: phage tail tape measure protein [Desulfobulbaceae bacterium]|nr:phage tail tape measure protein [Desulfobulbaceae bacterium]
MAPYPPIPLDFSGLNTYSVYGRHSKVSVDDFAAPVQAGMTVRQLLAGLPKQLAGVDFPDLVARIATAHRQNRPIILGMGAHVIKVGLNPVLIDLMQRGIITALALNGAGIIHDSEIAMVGRTSEEVAAVLGAGAFGAAQETGEVLNKAITAGAARGIGIGQAVGEMLLANRFPHNDQSLLAMAAQLQVPVTVHVAMGTDIIHIHPDVDGAAIGKAGHHDFRVFCRLVSELEGGVYLNVGSAVLLPEVFLKALTVARNLGHEVKQFTTANFDFIRHYRPATNVVHRPTLEGGKGFNFTGHHELMLPLLAAAIIDEIDK